MRSRCIPLSAGCLAGAAALLLSCKAAIPQAPVKDPPMSRIAAGMALRPVDSCEDLRAQITEAALNQLEQYGSYYGGYYWRGGLALEAGVAATADSGDSSRPSSFTTTNVQEAGVDELDFVKTDGKFLYLLQGDELLIVKSWPVDKAKEVGSLKIGGAPTSLFLDGNRALVVSSFYNYGDLLTSTGDAFLPHSYGGTRLTLVDLKDRTAPRVLRTIDFDGQVASGRMVEGFAYLVLNDTIELPRAVWELAYSEAVQKKLPVYAGGADTAAFAAYRAELREALRPGVEEILAKADLASMLPRYRDSLSGKERGLFSCSDVLRPSKGAPLGALSLVSLDLRDDRSAVSASSVFGNGWTIYASENSLYAAMPNSWWWWGSLDGSEAGTEIHKFDLKFGRPRYVASGKVDGWLLNQFSMSEHEGYLRVATTDFGSWSRQSGAGSHLTVLAERGGTLREVGAIRDIAPGESIYAARMMGDKGYLVTFRQVDPLFTLDLSNPKKPAIVGELKIPGYSSYLHPMDDTHLLAVGMDGTEDGRVRGMQVAIFDVSDMAKPRQVQKFTLSQDSWSWSEAMWDHHAFTYRDGVLSLPVSYYGYDTKTGTYSGFNGLLVLKTDPEEGISEIGRVDHSGLGRKLCLLSQPGSPQYCGPEYSTWYSQMRRSFYFDDNLVSISSAGLMINKLMTPKEELAALFFGAR
jgi:uncharacterized secreted protein with C-terminal beta-propeller domain